MKKITVVIPFYNEEGNILRLLKDLTKELSKINNFNCDICLIDDCSTDQGKKIVKSFIEKNRDCKIRLIENKLNIGKTFSIQKAIKLISTDFLIFMDGDYQDDPKDIKKIASKANDGYDLVIGYQDKNYSLFVQLCGHIYKLILNIFLDIKDIKNPAPSLC